MANRVLIVDDQRDVSRLLKSALETIEQGLDVFEAPSGEEAILEATRGKIDLLIADYRLPGITGIELMKKFRVRNPDIKVIMITGVTEPRARDEVEKAGADALFFKPVPMGEFLAQVEKSLGLARTVISAPPPEEEKAPPPPPEEKKSISGAITKLRQDLDAKTVTFLDTMGHIEAEAGELPDPKNAISLIVSLMGLYSAAQKVSGLTGRSDGHLHLFTGVEFDSVFVPVGASHMLYVVGKNLAAADGMLKTVAALRTASDDILECLKNMGVVEEIPAAEPAVPAVIPAAMPTATTPIPAAIPAPVAAKPEPAPVVEEVADDFLALLSHAADKPADASSFWDTIVEKGTSYAEPDKLTWEQASQLGLTPGETTQK
jgi:DNA-binding response OmpR family regulator